MWICISGSGIKRRQIMQVKQFLREKQQAAVLSISARTLRDWRLGKIVPYFKVGRVVFYDPERVQEALRKFERKEAAQ
jgi:transposase